MTAQSQANPNPKRGRSTRTRARLGGGTYEDRVVWAVGTLVEEEQGGYGAVSHAIPSSSTHA